MAKKRTIFNDDAQPRDETTEGTFEGRKISKLPPAPKEADGMATPEIEDGEIAIAADVAAGGKETFKITLGDIIDNAKSEFDEYNVKNLIAGTHVDDITETPVDSGNWTINAEKQRMDPGTFVESLNGVKGDVTLTSTDESIVIEPEEVLNPDTAELEFTGNIDLTLNTTTSSLYRAWIDVDNSTITSGDFDFQDDSITKDNSVVSINGVVLDGDQYDLSAGVVTILGLVDTPLQIGDVIGVISFVAETPNSLFNNPTYGLQTKDISIVGEDPNPETTPISVSENNLQTQQDVNWFLLREIENIDIPEDQDLSTYATIDAMEAGDDVTLADAKAYTDQEIAAIPPVDLSDYATKKESTDGDVKALEDSKKYTDQKVDAIVFPPGTIVKDTEPADSPNGTNWFDTVRLELFVRASDSWLPSSPLGARVSQGEAVQAQILDRIDGLTTTEYVDGADQAVQRFASTADEAVLNAAKKYTDDSLGTIPDVSVDVDKAYVDAQDATKIGNTGEQVLPTSAWKLRAPKIDDSGNYSYISIQDDTLRLYHVADPTADAHGMSRGYADTRYQFNQRQIVFKCDQYVTCTTASSPPDGGFCGLNNSSVGSATSPNPYFGNWNAGMRVALNKLLNPEGNQFSDGERYIISGTVTVIDKAGKLYFKTAVSGVNRNNNNSYVNINFATRVPAFGTGSYNDSSDYIVLIEGLESVVPATSNIPEGDE